MDVVEAEHRIRNLEAQVAELQRYVVSLAARQGLRVVLTQGMAHPAPPGVRQSAIASGPQRATASSVTKLEPAVRTRRGPQL